MNKLTGLFLRIRRAFKRRTFDAQMAEEMRTHVERETARRIAEGENPEKARRQAAITFGSVNARTEEVREARLGAFAEHIWQDVHLSLRGFAKARGFTAVAIITLALGIGANIGIFSLANAFLLRPLPVRNPGQLRLVHWTGDTLDLSGFDGSINDRNGLYYSGTFAGATLRDFRERAAGLADVFGFFAIHNLAIQTPGQIGVSSALMVSGNYFDGYGGRAAIGRLLTDADDRVGADPAAVITDRLWAQRFDRSPDALGQTVGVNGHRFTIVGVLAPDYASPITGDPGDVYIPLAAQPQFQPKRPLESYDQWWVLLMARLTPGASDAELQARLDASFAETLDQSRTEIGNASIALPYGRQGIVMARNRVAPTMAALQGIVAIVLLIACANVTGLMQARALARRKEFALCTALGAGRWRLMQRTLVESALLTAGGAAAGWWVSIWIKKFILSLIPNFGYTFHLDTTTDGRVLLFMTMLAAATTLLCGLVPAWRASRLDPLKDLQGGRIGGAERQRLGRILVMAQVALTLLLVATAGMFVRTVGNLRAISPGFDPENLLLFRLDAGQAGRTNEQRRTFFLQVQEELARVPGVTAVASGTVRLLAGSTTSGGFSIPGREQLSGVDWQANTLTVSDGYFEALEIPWHAGRDFNADDFADSQPVIVVNDLFAERFFPSEDPIGRIVTAHDTEYHIIGVCGSTLYEDVNRRKPPTIYHTLRQQTPGVMHFAVRSTLSPEAVATAARQTVAKIDSGIPVADVSTQDAQFDKSLFFERLFVKLCSSLAGLTVLLSCIGLYGLLAFSVVQRTSEIGVRMALGARPDHVARSILRDALAMTGTGVAVGLPIAVALGFAARGAFYNVAPWDPVILVETTGALLLAAGLAAWIPAIRAARIDPLTALRSE